MAKLRAMRHITRIDYEKKNQHGWWVRIHREGRMIQKFFGDRTYGNCSRALREAKLHRAYLLEQHPKSPIGNVFNRVTARCTSGIPGVHKTIVRKDGHTYTVWQTSWLMPNGKRVVKKFAYSDTGRSEKEAKRLAIKARNEGIAEIIAIRQAAS